MGVVWKNAYVFAATVQSIYAGMFLVSKVALNEGMNSFIFVFYRQAFGTLFMYPFAMLFERKPETPLTLVIFCKLFLLAFLGITLPLNLTAVALIYTSATLASATMNCLPIMTFVFAFIFGMEKVNMRTRGGVAKVLGIIMCMGGVAILAFYKGPHLKPSFINHPLFADYSSNDHHIQHKQHATKTWVIGCFMSFIAVGAWALWLVLQTQVLKSYPSKLYFTSIQCLSSAMQSFVVANGKMDGAKTQVLKSYPSKLYFTSIQCLSSAMQSFVVAILAERDLSEWKLGWNLRLMAVIYCGTLVTGFSYCLAASVLEMKGPVFQGMFTPINLIITTIASFLLLGESITLSSILGGVVLVVSLYSVLWGKSAENHDNTQSSDAKTDDGSIEMIN